MEERELKIALENYHFFLSSVERVQLEIEELNAKRFKIGGSIAKRPENPRDRESVIIENLEKLEKLQKSLDRYQQMIDLVNDFISELRVDEQELITDKYIKCYASVELETKHMMDRKTIWRRIEFNIHIYVNRKHKHRNQN